MLYLYTIVTFVHNPFYLRKPLDITPFFHYGLHPRPGRSLRASADNVYSLVLSTLLQNSDATASTTTPSFTASMAAEPPTELFTSWELAGNAVQQWAKEQGFAIVHVRKKPPTGPPFRKCWVQCSKRGI